MRYDYGILRFMRNFQHLFNCCHCPGWLSHTDYESRGEIFPRRCSKYDDLNASVQENITGIHCGKSIRKKKYENQKFFKAAENVYKMFVKAENIIVANMPLMMFTVYACILGLSWLGAKMIVIG